MEVVEVMKKLSVLLIACLMALPLITGCPGGDPPPPPPPPTPGPTADFSGSPTIGEQPLTVTFTDKSIDAPTSWEWDFGDGTGTATTNNPTYTYAAPGTYTVKLMVANAFGTDTKTLTNYITVSPPPPPPTLKPSQLQTVYFDFDKFQLRADAKADLDANYALMMEFPDAMVQIEGHCDERGTTEYNMSLGEKRANAARDYLIGLGIAENRLSTISYGEERPAATGSNEAAWDKNRRAEFKIVSQ